MKITVIGAGPGGYEAAIYAAKKGAEVILVEKDQLGGTCLNRGCIPTKAFLASYDTLCAVENAATFGINITGEVLVDYPTILERKNKLMDSLIKGINYLCEKAGVTIINGMGSLKDNKTVLVTKEDGSVEEIKTDYIILATGSVPMTPSFFKVDHNRVITSDEVLNFNTVPSSMIIVGGGVIGCEIGQFLHAMGTEMTIVEALPRLMATMDEDVSKQIARQFKKEKIKVICGDGITEINSSNADVTVKLESGKELSAEYVLVAVGRAPFTKGLNLEKIGVKVCEQGKVLVDEYMKTNIDNVFAIGDVVPSVQLAHVASKEGFIAVDNIFGEKKAMTYHAIPGCVFTNPELASCGTLEKDLIASGKEPDVDYRIGTFDFRGLGKAQASGHITGFVKVIADMDDVIIGAEIVGARASDMIQVLTTAVECGLTVKQVSSSIFPHPTMCEAIMEALHDIHKMSVHKA
ncbi:MAG: dihydrolipoyl dehydrogenase [Ruminococcaceae bacterium]|nr:dihydrolipoyl dehydrogenase [Oscillospiraceae bacterium]